jgi:hypothetical protein
VPDRDPPNDFQAERIRPIEQMLELKKNPCRRSISIPRCKRRRTPAIEAAVEPSRSKSANWKSWRRQEEPTRARGNADKLSRSLVILERKDTIHKKNSNKFARPTSFTQLQLLGRSSPRPGTRRIAERVKPRLSTVDDARTIQPATEPPRSRERRQSNLDLPDAPSSLGGLGGGRTFVQWVQIGFALTLPLLFLE